MEMTLAHALDDTALAQLALIAALGAWWISWRESRRNNKVIVKLLEARCTGRYAPPTPREAKLQITIRNYGLPLTNLSMSLFYTGPQKVGTFEFPIRVDNRCQGAAGNFMRGMTAVFTLSNLDQNILPFLGGLLDVPEQRPSIKLFSNSYLACTFPVVSLLDPLKRKWNYLATRKIIKRRVSDGVDGAGVYEIYMLPRFAIHSDELSRFLADLKKLGTASDT